MKKLQQTLVSLAAVMGSLAIVPTVSAAGTCQNGYTGPDSSNLCTSTTTYTCHVNNDNKAVIDNTNTQISLSGDGTTSGNTTGGNTQTGSATNSNGVTFNVSVKNGDICTTTATVPATPETPSTPITPGKGAVGGVGALSGGAGQVVTPTNVAAPSVLANTSGDDMLGYVGGAIVTLAGLIGVSRLVTLGYGRMKL